MSEGWERWEAEVASILALDRTISSGNRFHDPGDAVTRDRSDPYPLYADAKYTTKASFSLRSSELRDYGEIAAGLGKRFILPVRFGNQPRRTSTCPHLVGDNDYVVLTFHDFVELLDGYRKAAGDH